MNDDTPLMKIIRSRRSIRKYEDRPVPREALENCLEAARLAPSAENSQPWRFAVIDRPEEVARFCREAFPHVYRFNKFVEKAPCVVVIYARLDLLANRLGKAIQGTPYYLLDCAIAGEHFVLRAEELGLGTCWLGWYSEKNVKKILGLKRSNRVAACISLGYPASRPEKDKKRLSLDEIRCYGLPGGGE